MFRSNCDCNNQNNIHNYAIKCNTCAMRLELGFIQHYLHACSFSNYLPYNFLYNITKINKKEACEP
jgi:hypothetical protein